jgi:hypothetical protein
MECAPAGDDILLSIFLDRKSESLQGVLDLRGSEAVIVGRSNDRAP